MVGKVMLFFSNQRSVIIQGYVILKIKLINSLISHMEKFFPILRVAHKADSHERKPGYILK